MEKKKSRFVAAIITAMLGIIVWGAFLLAKDVAMYFIYLFAAFGFVAFACGLSRWLQVPGGRKH